MAVKWLMGREPDKKIIHILARQSGMVQYFIMSLRTVHNLKLFISSFLLFLGGYSWSQVTKNLKKQNFK